ncbi:plasmid partition protein ParG (plasmid) [Arsenophonus nasoniae]|uniref:ParG n=1 Tax=Arsenophonus nasoniae TaxID=638 RepID=A0A4P7L1L5_9GAMM|nr:plasmid partition protein ParG [Arsenophonus nasoniae]QBY46336.1 ParG [Arsenophonus nasoniae]WGM08642.1 plasmid partition protein ParG [Arsenophonus nasoniae]WGM13454.1 plasmid partition protein ParG [Arsenophonus nasoniae]WGM18037.1 plasmid partition protein ParG [Arsenophonus nasoniae]
MTLKKQNKEQSVMEFGEHTDLNKILDNKKQKDKRIQFIIDEDLHTDFKIQCLKNRVDMSTVLKGLIKNWLKKNGKL